MCYRTHHLLPERFDMETYTLTRDQLEALVRCTLDLEAIMDAGFDNWSLPEEIEWPDKHKIENTINEYK